MPAPDTSVKFLHSGMLGAPSLSGTAGALISVLDACLVNGFGSAAVDSIVVSGGIATATRSTGHPFEVGSVALISGATPAGLNGEKKVLSITSTTYTFDAEGISNQTATGSIQHRLAPLGFTKPFSGSNLAAYRSGDVQSTQNFLRVDDTGTTNARVVGYESMTDINTGTGPFPSSTQVSGGGFWGKASTTSGNRNWVIVGDSRGFYIHFNQQDNNATGAVLFYFGDIISRKSPDAYRCHLTAAAVTYLPSTTPNANVERAGSTTNGGYMPRSYTGVGGSIAVYRESLRISNSSGTADSGDIGPVYPNAVDNSLLVSPILVVEDTSGAVRGSMPGVYFCPMNVPINAFTAREIVTDVAGLSGRRLRAMTFLGLSSISFVDDTGPWR